MSAGLHAGAHSQIARAERLTGSFEELGISTLFVDSPVDLRYLTGFTGSHGLALLVGDSARASLGGHRFLTDFRYRTQSAEELPATFEREIVSGELLEALAARLAGTAEGRLGFDESHLSVRGHRRLSERLPAGWELVACAGALTGLRAVKDTGELARIRTASELAEEALEGLLEGGVVGRTERDVAIELESRMRRLGAEAPSFPSIVAAGAHGALPHASPRDEPIPRDVLVTIDWGALHEGYCSDCTRTFATGEAISGEAREIYELVLRAQMRGLEALAAGRSGREVDAQARAVIERGGHGEHFGHGLGHGVGMEVHEAPRLSRTAGEEPLLAGNVVTVEPGVYLPGRLGVRIEDLVVLGEETQELLTSLSKELTVIS